MGRKILLVLVVIGVAGFDFAPQAGAVDGSNIPLEKRGIIAGTMAHLKRVTLHEAPAFPAYTVNNDNVERADPETAIFIAGLLSNCLLDFWEQ